MLLLRFRPASAAVSLTTLLVLVRVRACSAARKVAPYNGGDGNGTSDADSFGLEEDDSRGPPLPVLGDSARCIRITEVEKEIPLAIPSNTPEELRGVFWMDQLGVYGHSNVPAAIAMPDFLVSFGDSTWDAETRSVVLSVTGPGWVWMNTPKGYLAYSGAWATGFTYTFKANDDLSVVQVISKPPTPGKHWMEKLAHDDSACPPEEGATKQEVARCATWTRVSRVAGKKFRYPVYRIVDSSGERVQPYFDEFVKFANSNCQPPVASLDGGITGFADPVCREPGTALVGRSAAAASAARGVLAALVAATALAAAS